MDLGIWAGHTPAHFFNLGAAMGDCVFCGKPAGWFKSSHPPCKQADDAKKAAAAEEEGKRARALAQCTADLQAAMVDTAVPLASVDEMVSRATEEGVLPLASKVGVLSNAWCVAAKRFLADDLLTDDEEARLHGALALFNLPPRDLDREGYLTKAGKASILKGVLRGETPQVEVPPQIPVNLQKSESLVWVEHGVRYLEDKARRQFVGRSRGVSVRVASGVYVRMGSFKGNPVVTTERVEVARGSLYVTDRNLYFNSQAHSMRIPFGKIVSFEKFTDGLGLMRDAASAKPQFFINGDGWFLYNLVTNLAYRD